MLLCEEAGNEACWAVTSVRACNVFVWAGKATELNRPAFNQEAGMRTFSAALRFVRALLCAVSLASSAVFAAPSSVSEATCARVCVASAVRTVTAWAVKVCTCANVAKLRYYEH